MPLKLLPIQEQDILAFAALDDAAMATSRLARAMSLSAPPGAPSRQETIEQWAKKEIAKSDTYYLKIVDTDLPAKDGACDEGEMISAAIWRFREAEHGRSVEAQAPRAVGEQEKNGEELAAPNVVDELGRQFTEFRANSFPGQAFLNLNVLVTHPDHQRRGAGSMLVKWGVDEADKRGIISVLQASDMGLGCYLKQGFEVVKEVRMNLKPYGIDEIEVRRDMMRQPETSA